MVWGVFLLSKLQRAVGPPFPLSLGLCVYGLADSLHLFFLPQTKFVSLDAFRIVK